MTTQLLLYVVAGVLIAVGAVLVVVALLLAVLTGGSQ